MKWIGVCVALGLMAHIATAQAGTGAIRGAVTSADGPVSAAPVRAKHQSTGRTFSTTTANAGQFALTDLPPGIYEVSVPQIGLANAPFVQRNVNVEAGQTTSLNIALVKGNLGVIGDDNAYLTIRNKYPNARGAAPRLADGRPDLSGIWNANVDPNPEPPALLPSANEVWRNRLSTALRDHPTGFCLPGDPTPTVPLLQVRSHKGPFGVALRAGAALPTDLSRRARPSSASRSDMDGSLRRQVGGRHTGRRYDRLQ